MSPNYIILIQQLQFFLLIYFSRKVFNGSIDKFIYDESLPGIDRCVYIFNFFYHLSRDRADFRWKNFDCNEINLFVRVTVSSFYCLSLKLTSFLDRACYKIFNLI